MGRGLAMSALTSSIACIWSRVSSKRKAASNSPCQAESPENADRSTTDRAA